MFIYQPVETKGGSSRGAVANVLLCEIIVRKFKLHSCYYIHFWTNILGKGMKTRIPPGMA